MEEKDKDQANPQGENGEVSLNDLEDENKNGEESAAKEGESEDKAENPAKKEGEKPKPKQSRETDAKFAEMRRKQKEEAERKDLESRIRKQVEFDVKKEAVSKSELEALGIDEVKTDEELLLVESYRKAKAEGEENPELAAYKALHAKQLKDREEANSRAKAKAEAEAEQTQIVANEQAEIRKKYGKSTGEILKEEPDFKKFFDRYGKAGNFDECYTTFHEIRGDSEQKAKQQGVFPTSGTGDSKGSPTKETDEEFLARTRKQYGNGF